MASAASLQFISLRDSSLPVPAGGYGDSGQAIVSADGRYVLFSSMAANLTVITNPVPQSGLSPRRQSVFLRDRLSQTTALVSFNALGNFCGNGDSLPAGVSANGQFALFESTASDLVTGDNNNAADVFLRDVSNGTNLLMSVRTNGGPGNGVSRSATMTPDGRYVAFVSAANNLVPGDTNRIPDVFVRDRIAGTTTLVSVGARPTSPSVPTGSSETPAITPDGRYVAFFSTATNLVTGVTNIGEVYVRDMVAGTTTMASTNARSLLLSVVGTQNGTSSNHRISDDGRYVVFVTATNPVAGLYSRGVLMRRDLQVGATHVVHTNANVPSLSPEDIRTLSLTPDGRFIAFIGNTNISGSPAQCVYRWDGQTTTLELVSQNLTGGVAAGTSCDWPTMDASGRYVAFISSGGNLVGNTLVGSVQVYLRDMQAGTTELISQSAAGVGYAVNTITAPSLSGYGQVLIFDAMDGELVTADLNGVSDVFARDRAGSVTELISTRHQLSAAVTPRGASGSFSVSSNGQWVAFASDGKDVVAGDNNGFRDVFARDLALGTTMLVSVATNGSTGNGISFEPAISGDGRFVAFTSYANNLVPGDSNNFSDVFVRDLLTGTTVVASVTTNSLVAGNGDSRQPTISSDGRYVTFWSPARNLVAGSTAATNLFQRDLQAGSTRALSTGGGIASSVTPDGNRVAFLGLNAGDSGNRAYVWDNQLAARVYTNTTSSLNQISISPNGERLAMVSGLSTLRVVDLVANTNGIISAESTASRMGPRFNTSGRFLAFYTPRALVAADTNGVADVYLYDFDFGTNLLVSRSFDSLGSARGAADASSISPDGRFITYRTAASNAVPNDFNAVTDLLLYDRLGGATILLTVNRSGAFAGDGFGMQSAFSGDGQKLVLTTWASDLISGDYNASSDVISLALGNAFVDSDDDGLDDDWETTYFSSLGHDGNADSDNDGAIDRAEFQASTNPTNALSSFRATISLQPAPTLRWPAVAFKSYRVECKNDLNDSSWSDLGGSVSLSGTNGMAVDLSPLSAGRSYRIKLEP